MPELALPGGDARQQGTATAAQPCPAWVPAGLSPGAHIAPGDPGQTQIPPPGASLFHKELLLSQCWQQGEQFLLAFAKPRRSQWGSTRPGTPVPPGPALGLACPLATYRTKQSWEKKQEEPKKRSLLVGQEQNGKKK